MKNFDALYNDLPKTEIHIHLEGAIRTQTIIDVAREYDLELPVYDLDELDKHVKVYDQMRDLEAVLEAFAIFQNSITSPQVVERIAWELFEDAAARTSACSRCASRRTGPSTVTTWIGTPPWRAFCAPRTRAEREFDMAIGYIAITSRSMGPDSCTAHRGLGHPPQRAILGIDLADSEDLTSRSASSPGR